MPASLSVGHNSGSAWVSVSPDPLLCVHYFLSLWFSPTIKYESDLAKLKVLDISWSWLSAFSCLTVLLPPIDVKMTKLGFLRLSYEKQDTLLKLLILSMAAVLCECACGPLFLQDMERRKF